MTSVKDYSRKSVVLRWNCNSRHSADGSPYLQLVSESKNEVIFSGNGTLKFNNPTQVVDLVFLLQRLHFNYPDTYWIKFLIDGEPLMTRPIRVDLLKPPAEQTAPGGES